MRKTEALPMRDRDHYRARPSESEPGQWTIMRQLAGKTYEGLFARVVDVQDAAKILAWAEHAGAEVEAIKSIATFDVASAGATSSPEAVFAVDLYADGSLFRQDTGQRVPKKDHPKLFDQDGAALSETIREVLDAFAAAAGEG